MKLQNIFTGKKKPNSIFKGKKFLDNFFTTKNPKMFLPRYGGGYYGIDQTASVGAIHGDGGEGGDGGGGDGGGGGGV